jgi:hypothetical protein
MPQKSDPPIVHAGDTAPPVDGSVPIARLSDPLFELVSFSSRLTFGDVAVNPPPDPWHAAETISPPAVVEANGAARPDAGEAANAVTTAPSDPAPVTVTDPALWLFASDTATETVLDPVGHVGPVRPYSATPPAVPLLARTNPRNGTVTPP